MFGGSEEDEVEVRVKAESDDPMVCITHLHTLLEGEKCEGEKQMEKCKLCGETLESKRELLSHLKIHKSKKILEENQLNSSAVEVEGREGDSNGRQKRKHDQAGPILPRQDQAEAEAGPIPARKRRMQDQAGPILCPNCGSSFNSKTLVTRHQRYAAKC